MSDTIALIVAEIRTAEQPGARIRVLYLLDEARGGGGAERLALSVLERLDPSKFDRFICFSRPTGEVVARDLQDAGIGLITLNRRSRLDVLPWARLLRIGRKEKFDIIHSHKHGSNFWGAIISALLRVPVFFAHEHSWPYAGDRFRVLVDRFLIAPRATRMIAVSNADREAMIAVERIDPSRIIVLPNGIATESPGDVEALREELGLAKEALVVVCVGARPEKRVDRLLTAVASLRHAHPQVRLLVIGRSSEESRLRELAASLAVEDLVSFLGHRTDISTLLQLADVGVIASDREGSPLAILEYMAAGCSIVATRVGGIPEIVRDGAEALLVEPGDPEALASAIGQLLLDPARRAALGAAAQERQIREFSLERTVAQTTELYEQHMAATPGRGGRRASDLTPPVHTGERHAGRLGASS